MAYKKEDYINTSDLTETQIKFCNAYVSNGGNVTKACESVRISRPTAYTMLKLDKIKAYLEVITTVEKDIATSEELLEILSKIAKGEIKDEILNMKTGEIVKVLPSSISRTQAISTILKTRGELTPPIQLNQYNLYNLPDTKDLTKLIESKQVKEVPLDVDYIVIDAEDEGEANHE
jgi:phage terminase small subunit